MSPGLWRDMTPTEPLHRSLEIPEVSFSSFVLLPVTAKCLFVVMVVQQWLSDDTPANASADVADAVAFHLLPHVHHHDINALDPLWFCTCFCSICQNHCFYMLQLLSPVTFNRYLLQQESLPTSGITQSEAGICC